MPWPALVRLTLLADDQAADTAPEPHDPTVDSSRRVGLNPNARPFRPPTAADLGMNPEVG